MDIAAWLRGLGLERYEAAFRDNEIDAAVLPELTDEHLKELGLPLGPRLKLLKAIAALRAEPPPRTDDEPVTPPVAADAMPRDRAGAAAVSEAERRQLTVMFVDLVGSTTLSGRLDPEDVGAVIRAYQDVCAGVIARFEGHVAKYMGDGVLAYFGYPKAHEDDAERAVRAGLGVVEAVGRLAAPDDGTPLAARVGIATGLVVVGGLVGEGAAQEQAVIGETPNLAARLQDLGEPNGVIIGRRTRQLVGGLFELADLGAHRVKGFARPVQAWRVVGEGAAESRFEALHAAAGLTPLVGREHELALLLDRWQLARGGEGQVVLLSGEPGIGKSRLVRALRERLGGEPHTSLSHYGSPFHRTSALHPVIGLLERAAGFARDDPPARRLDRLEALLAQATGDVLEAAPLLAALLAIPAGGRYPPLDLTPQRQKERTFAALLDQLAGLAAQQPVLDVYEDVHWSDPTTLELLGLVVDRVQALPVLLLITFRPEFTPPWGGRAHVTALTLSRLGRRQGGALIERVTGGKALPVEVAEQIVAKTDGVPLFVEELTKAVLESGLLTDAGDRYVLKGALPPLAIPATLHDSLLARLDRLAPVKEVAQIGAVIGREFSRELLAVVAPLGGNELEDALNRLVRAELVFRRGTPPDASYSFKHALVQDAAYQSLLRSRRQQLHARIAQVLEERFPATAETEPELLAHHCTEAGLVEKAVFYWQGAGQRALARSAMAEAIVQSRNGLDLLARLPESAGRWRDELKLQGILAAALVATKGNAAAETGQAYARARALCERLGDTTTLVPVLSGLSTHHQTRGEYAALRRTALDLLRLGRQMNDTASELVGNRSMALCLYHFGEFGLAREHFERVLNIYVPEVHHSITSIAAFDMRAVALSYLSLVFLILGYPEQGRQWNGQALAWSRNLRHPHTLAFSLNYATIFHLLERTDSPAEKLIDELRSLAVEHRFPVWLAGADVMRGHVLAARAEAPEGLSLAREGLAARTATGSTYHQTLFLGLLAESCRRAGEADEAVSLLTTALEIAASTGERWFEAELLRLKGEYLVARRPAEIPAAETCLDRAVAVAREQGAKLWELRAAMSLARLWRDQGRCTEAHDLLAPIYGRFTEGFATPDLKDAKALLDELGWTTASPAA